MLDRHGEAVEVPTQTVVASVRINGPEDAVVDCGRDLMVEIVARKCCVVDLDVDLDLVLQAVLLQEAVHRRDVVVVLVLRGLHRLGLDQQRTLESNRVFVLDDQIEEATELVHLTLHVSIEQRLVALASAPQHVVGAAELLGRAHAMGHLRGCIAKRSGVGVGGRASHESAVGEGVGGAPQQLDTGALHMASGEFDHLVEVATALCKRGT